MVSTKYAKDTEKLIKFITKKQHKIRGAFKPVTISIHSSLQWICFDLPAHRYPQVIDYIKHYFKKKHEQIKLRFRPLVLKNLPTEQVDLEQLQYFTKSEHNIIKANKFIIDRNLCDSEPFTRYNPRTKKYHLKS